MARRWNRKILESLGVKQGMLGVIFKGARCEIHNPALLKQPANTSRPAL
jgi:hypothetical protein